VDGLIEITHQCGLLPSGKMPACSVPGMAISPCTSGEVVISQEQVWVAVFYPWILFSCLCFPRLSPLLSIIHAGIQRQRRYHGTFLMSFAIGNSS
jgi:hypothetical protein